MFWRTIYDGIMETGDFGVGDPNISARTMPYNMKTERTGPPLAALEDIAQGNSAFAVARLRQLDRRLASDPDTGLESAIGVRARSRILMMSEALSQHASYFDAGASA